jgi:hypothetical protein
MGLSMSAYLRQVSVYPRRLDSGEWRIALEVTDPERGLRGETVIFYLKPTEAIDLQSKLFVLAHDIESRES